MKKRYMEPQMIVEDFSVSEMVAKGCGLVEGELKITTQYSDPAGYGSARPGYCDGSFEDPKKDQAYTAFSDLFDNDYTPTIDESHNGVPYDDTCFTEAVIEASKKVSHIKSGICEYIPTENFNSVTAGSGFVCSSDSSLLQNSL